VREVSSTLPRRAKVALAVQEPIRDPSSSDQVAAGPKAVIATSKKRQLLVRFRGLDLPGRILWTLAGVETIQWAIRISTSVTVFPWVAWPMVLLGLWGLILVSASWIDLPERSANRNGIAKLALFRASGAYCWITVAFTVGAFWLWSFLQVHAAPGYGTDEAAFDQYAALLSTRGLNPYLHSMAPSFALYKVSPDGFTYRLNGTPVTSLSYPALAFEVYMPLIWLGLSTQAAVVLNCLAWGLGVVIMVALLPRSLRPAGVVLGSITTYIAYAVGGVTDMLYLPLLVGAAYRWNEFGTRRGLARWGGPVLMGLAMAIKQTPWLVFPFVLFGVAETTARRNSPKQGLADAGRYAGAALLAFLVPNSYFIVVSPVAWLKGVLTPLISGAVPAGQGVVGLALFLRLGGGSLLAFSLLALAVYLALLGVYVFGFPVLARATWALPAVALFFNSRSFGSYLVCLVPATVVGAVSFSKTGQREGGVGSALWPRMEGPGVVAKVSVVSGLLVAGVAAFAFSSSPPLRVDVVGVRTTGQLATVEQVTVAVRNTSDRPLEPHFTVDQGGAVTTFWLLGSGPKILGPHREARYVLLAPNFYAQPPIGGGFQVVAFTSSPPTASTSAAYLPGEWHVSLVPAAINRLVPAGQNLVIHAQLMDQFDRPVRVAGVPIYLGQIIYDQQGLEYSEAVINGGEPGETPVSALTNADGVATFDVIGTQVTSDPVYFEANLVNSEQFYPYGYSEILPIRFTKQ
jgi:hypothetical protein